MDIILGIVVAAALVVAFVVYRIRAAGSAKESARQAALEELTKTGLRLEGDPLDRYTLEGNVNGIAITLENRRSVLFPSGEGESVYGCLLRVPVKLPDLLVCSTTDIDKLLGPLPAARRVRTQHQRFEMFFALFMSGSVTPPEGTYRAVAEADRGPFGRDVLDAFVDLGMKWLRVREGRLEIVFRVLDDHEIGRVISLGAQIAG